jgi:hypothetical protein
VDFSFRRNCELCGADRAAPCTPDVDCRSPIKIGHRGRDAALPKICLSSTAFRSSRAKRQSCAVRFQRLPDNKRRLRRTKIRARIRQRCSSALAESQSGVSLFRYSPKRACFQTLGSTHARAWASSRACSEFTRHTRKSRSGSRL